MTSAKKKEIPVYIHPEYKTAETAKELTPLKNIEDAIKYKTKKQLKQEKKAAQKGVSTRDVFVREIFDDLDELAKTEKALNVQQGKTILKGAEREGLQSAESSLYKRARLYKGAQGKVAQDVKDAEAILNTLGKEYGGVTPQELSTYAAARRAKWLKEQRGIETGFSPESVNATLAKYANNPAKQAAMDKASESAYIQGICDMASYAIDAYCRQTFVATTGFVESGVVRVRCGVVRYFPKNLTISKVNSMTFNSVNGQAVQFTIDNYEYETDRGYIIGWTNAFDGLYRCTVSYDFGFATYPSDLVKATVLACAPLLDDYFLAQESNVNMVKVS